MQVAADTLAVVGSRRMPVENHDAFYRACEGLAAAGWRLRSGGAPVCDEIAEKAWDVVSAAAVRKEIYEPAPGWRTWPSRVYQRPPDGLDWAQAARIAEKHHPNWAAIRRAGLLTYRLMCRNSFQVLGANLASPAFAVICWTPDASGSGGTGQALRIAASYGVPVLDLGNTSPARFATVVAAFLKERLTQRVAQARVDLHEETST